jgi:hypothetical protein
MTLGSKSPDPTLKYPGAFFDKVNQLLREKYGTNAITRHESDRLWFLGLTATDAAEEVIAKRARGEGLPG